VSSVLPRVVQAWFGSRTGASGDVLIAVMSPAGPVYLSDPAVPVSRYLPGDVAIPFFGTGPLGDERDWNTPPVAEPTLGPAWRLVVTHRAGSLEAAVGHLRNRNLAISTAIMLLLVGAVALLALAARRAHRLARQQVDFVAGVTHELNTPIAAMRSAAQNLADGVVSDPAQVRRYGALIEREGSRLSSLVAKALELAGIQAGRARTYHPEPVALPEVVDEVLAGSRFALEEKGVEVERDLPAGLPPVLADRRGVHLAVQNLIDNALKHAAGGRWIGVRAAAASDGRSVTLAVDDRGPGITAADRAHVFEPFYRGRSDGAATVPGGGIGLGLVREIVEAQGGRVAVADGPDGRGASFTVQLPAAASPAEGAPA
jgi:signal transduction histidine kinase